MANVDAFKVGPHRDRRRKLSDADREEVIRMGALGMHVLEIASHFGVSRRLIEFILDPSKLERNKELFRRRREAEGWYLERNAQYMRNHRAYKKSLMAEKGV